MDGRSRKVELSGCSKEMIEEEKGRAVDEALQEIRRGSSFVLISTRGGRLITVIATKSGVDKLILTIGMVRASTEMGGAK